MLSFDISHHDHCRRMESFLRTLMPNSPFSYARKLINSGAARLNGTATSPDTPLIFHDTVTLKESAATVGYISSVRPALDILYEDGHIVIVNKPSGMPMHRTAECEENLVENGQNYMTERDTPCKLYPVNRLDRGTSGSVILAKSSSSAGIYGRQVKETGLDKLYLALVQGTPDGCGIINVPLDEKESETRYRILLQGVDCSLLAVTPISGRMHQIRRHLSAIGHPVIGDKRYGGGELPEFSGFALHSFRTALVRETAVKLAVSAPLDDEMLSLCRQRGIDTDLLFETLLQLI
ncbi:MAG: RluA family pseudouridine synthase [Desulfuromonadaceae bacterium]|nr:RluA family pseudouridine synthase [Desulfuromonadaceae bacterium]MDD5104924.1 RluA family pseudouridine synthase [Desulfuromonadaceae bacterium]